jgi:hypothetical protein
MIFLGFFGHKKEINVPLTSDVMMKCKCVTCPVQVNSACAKPKVMARMEMVKNTEMSKKMSPEMAQNMTPEMMKNMTPEMMKDSGMMKNAEMLKNMSLGQMRSMSREDMKKMSDEMMKNTPKEQIVMMKPNVEDMPGPYCANGVAFCKDLDFSKICICSGCEVFKDFSLMKAKPTIYFCKDGKAT